MKTSKQRAIAIRGDHTKEYEQVIFIMKEDKKPIMNFVEEAERIINSKKTRKAVVVIDEGVKKVIIEKSFAETAILNSVVLISAIGLLLSLFFIAF
ncbi:MAG: hypothetical protein FWF50_06205 [Defluviitaleaceae bacterium]|nr:hypothetical protein [Defluviitaleaceae bacterium]